MKVKCTINQMLKKVMTWWGHIREYEGFSGLCILLGSNADCDLVVRNTIYELAKFYITLWRPWSMLILLNLRGADDIIGVSWAFQALIINGSCAYSIRQISVSLGKSSLIASAHKPRCATGLYSWTHCIHHLISVNIFFCYAINTHF